MKRRKSGSTLVEVLMAMAFMSACTAVMLGAVTSNQERANIAWERSIVLQRVLSELDAFRSTARLTTLPVGTTTIIPSLAGVGSVRVDREISAEVGVADLYLVTVTATWTSVDLGHRQTLQISTKVIAPEV